MDCRPDIHIMIWSSCPTRIILLDFLSHLSLLLLEMCTIMLSKILRWSLMSGFLSIQIPNGVLLCNPSATDLFRRYTAVFTVSDPNFLPNPASNNKHLAFSTTVLFIRSDISFCSGVYGFVFWWSIPTFL